MTIYCVMKFDGSVEDFVLVAASSFQERAQIELDEIKSKDPKACAVIAPWTHAGMVEHLTKQRLGQLYDVLLRLESKA